MEKEKGKEIVSINVTEGSEAAKEESSTWLSSWFGEMPDAQSSGYIGTGSAVGGAAMMGIAGPVAAAGGVVAGGVFGAYLAGSFILDAISKEDTTATVVPEPAITYKQELQQELQKAFRKVKLVNELRVEQSNNDRGDGNPLNWNASTATDDAGDLVIHLSGEVSDA